jgi:hypothetical protein
MREEKADVQQEAPIEPRVSRLFHDMNGTGDMPIEFVALDIRRDIRNELRQAPGAITLPQDDRQAFVKTCLHR